MPDDNAQGTEKRAKARRKPASWMLKRLAPDGSWETCALHQNGVRLERFPAPLPTIQQIGDVWGSGRYKVGPFGPDNQPMGWRAAEELDDPERPRRDAYAGRPHEAAPPSQAPLPPPPLPPPPPGPGGVLGGMLGAPALALITWMDQTRREAQEQAEAAAQRRHELAMKELEWRQAQSEKFATMQIEAIRASTEQTIQQQQAHFRAMAELMRGGYDDDDDDDGAAGKVIAALDAVGIDDDARRKIAPGLMSLLELAKGRASEKDE